jgi:hypothetical protein
MKKLLVLTTLLMMGCAGYVPRGTYHPHYVSFYQPTIPMPRAQSYPNFNTDSVPFVLPH